MFRTEIQASGPVRHRAIGPITIASISAAYLGWARNPDFDPFAPIVWDLRGQVIDIPLDQLIRLPQWTNRITGKLRPGLRSAVLVDNSVAEYGATLAISNANWAAEFRVFLNENEALAWLSPGPDHLGGS